MSGIAIFVLCMFWDMRSNMDKRDSICKFVVVSVISLICFGMFSVITPTTERFLKIIATKKGIDAIKSETGVKYIYETDKLITNGLKVLNEKIENKLEKK
jgi:hypothetical protein